MQDQFAAATPQEQEQLSKLKARMSSQLLPFRDPNGFRKLVVVLTEPGLPLGPSWMLPLTRSELTTESPRPNHLCSTAVSFQQELELLFPVSKRHSLGLQRAASGWAIL